MILSIPTRPQWALSLRNRACEGRSARQVAVNQSLDPHSEFLRKRAPPDRGNWVPAEMEIRACTECQRPRIEGTHPREFWQGQPGRRRTRNVRNPSFAIISLGHSSRMDNLTPEERSKQMSLIRSKDTKPQLRVGRLVHGLGYRYRLHVAALPGNPDHDDAAGAY